MKARFEVGCPLMVVLDCHFPDYFASPHLSAAQAADGGARLATQYFLTQTAIAHVRAFCMAY